MWRLINPYRFRVLIRRFRRRYCASLGAAAARRSQYTFTFHLPTPTPQRGTGPLLRRVEAEQTPFPPLGRNRRAAACAGRCMPPPCVSFGSRSVGGRTGSGKPNGRFAPTPNRRRCPASSSGPPRGAAAQRAGRWMPPGFSFRAGAPNGLGRSLGGPESAAVSPADPPRAESFQPVC